MNVTCYLPDELGEAAKKAELPLSRLLRAAVEEELERRATMKTTLAEPEEYYLPLEDRDGRAYTGRVVGAQIAEGTISVYLTEDERVIAYDERRMSFWTVENAEEELREGLSPDQYLEAMDALGISPTIDL